MCRKHPGIVSGIESGHFNPATCTCPVAPALACSENPPEREADRSCPIRHPNNIARLLLPVGGVDGYAPSFPYFTARSTLSIIIHCKHTLLRLATVWSFSTLTCCFEQGVRLVRSWRSPTPLPALPTRRRWVGAYTGWSTLGCPVLSCAKLALHVGDAGGIR